MFQIRVSDKLVSQLILDDEDDAAAGDLSSSVFFVFPSILYPAVSSFPHPALSALTKIFKFLVMSVNQVIVIG